MSSGAETVLAPSVTQFTHGPLTIAYSGVMLGNVDTRPEFNDPEAAVRQKRLLQGFGDHKFVLQKVLLEPNIMDLSGTPDDELEKIYWTDGLIINRPSVALGLNPADCSAMTIFDKHGSSFGLIHVGRQGIDGDIHIASLDWLMRQHRVDPQNIGVHFSPSIRKASYHFDPAKAAEVFADPKWKRFIEVEEDSRAHVDVLARVVSDITDSSKSVGVNPDNITIEPIDTGADRRFFSHVRRARKQCDENPVGRNGHAVMLNHQVESFYKRNRIHLPEFASLFDLDPSVTESLDSLVKATQPWVRGDHTRPENRARVTEAEGERLHRLYKLLGLKDERPLDPGHYDYLLVLGGIYRGTNRRLAFLKKTLEKGNITTDQIVFLGGEREVYPEVENTLIADHIEQLKGSSQRDPFVRHVIGEYSKKGTGIRHESDLFRLAAAVQLGSLALTSETDRQVEFIYSRAQSEEGTDIPVVLLHTQAESRPNGKPRHTTEACIRDFIRTLQPRRAARIGFIATNPHIERTTRSAQRNIDLLDRSDLRLTPAGPGALDTYSHELFRGEVARLLYEDQLVESVS